MTHPTITKELAGHPDVMIGRITQDVLQKILSYDATTGVFIWKAPRSNRTKVGDVAGVRSKRGYVYINLKGKMTSAHRLAWLYMTGEIPASYVDHINGVKNDNSFSNLRLIDKAGNGQNIKKAYKNNTSGFLGVSAKDGLWVAQIKHQGKKISIGYFKTPEEAHAAYLQKKRELHAFNTL